MKKLNFLLSSLLLCMCCTIQAKNKVIEQPPFVVSNTTSIEVNQVEISDTATVLHIFAKYRPKNWIKIASGSYLQDNKDLPTTFGHRHHTGCRVLDAGIR